jgi:release factor glutamine methyltransferase
VSAAALAVARENGERLGLDVDWRCSDWFEALGGERFDAIVCNPPYVASTDPHFAGALGHEPRLALDGGADGLDALRTLVASARPYLQVAAWLLVEHGFDQQDAAIGLARAAGYRVASALRDLGGQPRALVLQAPWS